MKLTLLAAGLVAAVFAQDLTNIPECARSCLMNAITQDGQCQPTNTACVCGRIDQLTGLATGCVLSGCGQDVAINQVLPAVQGLCTNVGSGGESAAPSVPPASLPEPQPTPSEASPSSPPSPTGSDMEEPSAMPTESQSSPTGSATQSTVTNMSSATGSGGVTGASASPTSSAVTAGAAQYGSVSGLAAFFLGAIAFF
ncbi:hypothetical protein DHEL01_v206186 [Diaporthe helianthi]|uniref:CFEM domain-containing protein n=1 Tax=Diaporthe helianthi TaxID=158607 RepID=A0A2P5HYV2_DIAHE|nr:hypothetical protein DHEL01_v206186 [Diaporthe helianthi]